MNVTEVQDSLQNLINTKISLAEIGNILGVSRASISQRAKVGRDMKREELKLIGDHFNVDLMPNSLVIDNKPEETFKMDYYPDVFGSCGTGYFVSSEEKEQIQVPVNALFKKLSKGKKYSVINAKGTSMSPYIEPGDKLIIEHLENQPIVDNHVYVFCYDKDLYIKRLYKNIDEIIAKSDNPDPIFKVKSIPKKEWDKLQLIGEIVGLMRDLR